MAEAALAGTSGSDIDKRLELAFEEGHDADIPTEAASHALHDRPNPNPADENEMLNDHAGQSGASKLSTRLSDDKDIEAKDDSTTSKDIEKAAGSSSSASQAGSDSAEATPADPNIVDWDGPDDPENPQNWSAWKKWFALGVVSGITFVTPLASSMFAPGVPQLMQDFHSSNTELASFVVSVYILGFCFGPLLVAPLSELYGRLPLYHVSNVLFIVFAVACAVSTDIGMFIVFRFLQGVVGVTPLTVGGGTIADVIPQERRGAAMAIWALGPLLGPVVGPVAGGYLNEAAGWRWIFWLIAIIGGVLTIMGFIFIRETYAPVLLERKAKKLRKETGNPNLRSKLDPGIPYATYFKRAIVRPTKMLFRSPIVFLFSLHVAIVYGYLYLLFTTVTYVFEDRYGFTSGQAGLTYLGIGVGMFGGLFIVGFASDKMVKKKANGGEMKPEYRLPPLILGAFCVPIGLFWYGWSAEEEVFWIVPIIGTVFVGIGLLATFMPVQTYIIDAYTLYAASATAALTVVRSLFGAVLPLAGQSMYAKLGLGWGNSLLAFIAVAMIPVPFLFMKYGERIRTSPRWQVQF